MSLKKSESLCPSIKWADNNSNVFVTVMLRDIENEKVQVKQDSINFEGVSKNQSYAFNISLFQPVCPKKSKIFKTGSSLLFQLTKQKTQQDKKWPRLTKDKNKYQFIQIDWDRWQQQSDNQKDEENSKNKKPFDSYNRLRGDDQNYDDQDDDNHKRENVIDDFYGDSKFDDDNQKIQHQDDYSDIKNQYFNIDEQDIHRDGNQEWYNNDEKNQSDFHDND